MNYVREIDGLRAVAVTAVLLFHVEYRWAGGGFVGVDVFFVISGFLISRIILGDIDRGGFSIARFYERRIRRIAPALIAMLAACLAFLILLPPATAATVQRSMYAALFSASNFWFFATTDYFHDNSYNPLLHTWSLSVEEQFYIVLPPALWLASRWLPRARTALVAAAFGASLLAAEWVVRGAPSAAFYLPWLRAWELLAGTLLALLPLPRIDHRLRIALSHAGLAAILLACATFTTGMRFPGASALLPVLGSCAVIAGAGLPSPANWLLGLAPMRFLGRISYSLYLVHWPLVALVGTVAGVTPKARLAILATSILLAWLSWRWIEMPFRQAAPEPAARRRLFRGFALALAALSTAFAVVGLVGGALWQRFPAALAYAGATDVAVEEFGRDPCWFTGDEAIPGRTAAAGCLRLDPARRSVLLIGDSHAAHLASALREDHPDVQLLVVTRALCAPFSVSAPDQKPSCAAMLDDVFRDWLPRVGPAVGEVILSARWSAADLPYLQATLRDLRAIDKQVVVIGPSPEFSAMVPLLLAWGSILSRDLGSALVRPDSFALDARLAGDPQIAPHYFSPIERLCPAHRCLTALDGAPLYFDRDHLTEAGARIALQGLTP